MAPTGALSTGRTADTMKIEIRWTLGLLSPRSHYTVAGKPKVRYGSETTAQKAADSMERKTGRPMDAYRCWVYCLGRGWHIGGSVREDR